MSSLFWSESFWLPTSVSWSEIEKRGIQYPRASDLIWDTFKWTLIMGALRAVLIRFCFQPLGMSHGVNTAPPIKVNHRDDLEKEYLKVGRKIARWIKNRDYLDRVARQVGLTEEEVKNWLRQRWGQDDLPDIEKFNQECWLSFFYVILNAYGFYNVIGKSWLWKMDEVWAEWPFQNVDNGVPFYFTLTMTFIVLDSIILCFKQHDRKGHIIICVHHLLAGLLVFLSWASNTTRLGAVIIFILEMSSPVVYIGRAVRRMGYDSVAEILVAILGVVWTFNRALAPLFFILPAFLSGRQFIESTPVLGLSSFLSVVIFSLISLWTFGVYYKIVNIIFSQKKKDEGRWKYFCRFMTSIPDLRKEEK